MRTLSLLSLFITGCTLSSGEPARGVDVANAKVFNVGMLDHTLKGEQIFRIGSGVCPTTLGGGMNHWDVSPLFEGSAGVLQRTCRAVWSGAASPEMSLLSGAVPEAVVVGPLAGPEFPSDVNLANHTRSRTAPFAALPTLTELPARLAILDAMGDGPLDTAYFLSTPAFSDHGQRVSTIAHGIACDDTGYCAVDLRGYATLKYRYDNTNPVAYRGLGSEGAVGSQSDLAEAIYLAVREWRIDRDEETVGRLVINISAGWHGYWGGEGPINSFDPNVHAVFDALGYASCHGALVFAAAGNLGGLSGDSEPLYPAAWERLPATSSSSCQSKYAVTPRSGASDTKRLIYAVGGVAANHEPLGISRPGSVPSLVAAGSVVAFENPSTGNLMLPLTGTSASTVVVAASAALVRSYLPSFTHHQTVDVLREGATDAGWIGSTPEFCPGGGTPCDAIHVITPCHALAAACDGAACAVTGSHCDAEPQLVELLASRPASLVDWDPDFPGSCPNTWIDVDYPSGSPNQQSECPIQSMNGVSLRPLTLPMPPTDPCLPHCELFLQSVPALHFAIGTEKISDSSILVTFTSGLKKTFEVGALNKNTVITFKDLGSIFDSGDSVKNAVFTYSYKGTPTAGATELLLIDD